MNAVPFGYQTWETLTTEAGTPLFDTELAGQIPNVLGLANAVDFEKGCFVGQEVVSKVENRGQPSRRLVGLVVEGTGDALPDVGSPVTADGDDVGEVTRVAGSPTRESAVALAYVDFGLDAADVAVEVDGEVVPASTEPLPLVEGTERSARIPRYG